MNVKLKDNRIVASFVKYVGKKTTSKKQTCWIEQDDIVEEIDFSKDADSWKYEKKSCMNFVDSNELVDESQKQQNSRRPVLPRHPRSVVSLLAAAAGWRSSLKYLCNLCII